MPTDPRHLTDAEQKRRAHARALDAAIIKYNKDPTFLFEIITKNMKVGDKFTNCEENLIDALKKLKKLGWEVRYVGKSQSGQGSEAGKGVRKPFEERGD
tara:strand:- start:2021 stop:2317 length:297 start_codon:yes stop_codon:yes gene_type:complete